MAFESAGATDAGLPDLSRAELWAGNGWAPIFERLRAEDPVSYCPQSAYGPYWSITRYDDVMAVETDPAAFSSSWEKGGMVVFDTRPEGFQVGMFIAMDDPEHGEKRKAVAPAVTPAAIAGLARVLREQTEEILDAVPVGIPFDWVQEVSVPLTTAMIAALFDFPVEERHNLPVWSDWAARFDVGLDPRLNAQRARHLFRMSARFGQLYEDRRAAPPAGDLLSMMAHSGAYGAMGKQEFLGAITLLLVGGNDTTRNAMSGLVEQICRFPEVWAQVKADPARLAAAAASETIRLQAPIAHMRRTATRDVELNGKLIRKGDKVLLWYGSANRDETVFPDAERWDPTRKNVRRHLSFGHGIHRCMGARLAELQLATLIEEMAKRDMELALKSEPVRLPSCFINGFQRLEVEITPRPN